MYQFDRTFCVGFLDWVFRERNEKHFLLACYLLYYCFIRPVEMTRLRVRDFNLKESTITIPAESAKNKTTQTVTVPKKVLLYAIDLGIFATPMDNFIFSYNLRPGRTEKPLGLKKEWKFYSLKDTGITEMCDRNMATIAVRDQARHSSLAITDIYTRHSSKANQEIVKLDGAL